MTQKSTTNLTYWAFNGQCDFYSFLMRIEVESIIMKLICILIFKMTPLPSGPFLNIPSCSSNDSKQILEIYTNEC